VKRMTLSGANWNREARLCAEENLESEALPSKGTPARRVMVHVAARRAKSANSRGREATQFI